MYPHKPTCIFNIYYILCFRWFNKSEQKKIKEHNKIKVKAGEKNKRKILCSKGIIETKQRERERLK